MNEARSHRTVVVLGVCFISLCAGVAFPADQDPALQQQLQQLREQNETLQRQMQQQKEMIDSLSRKVAGMESIGESRASRTSEPSKELSAPAAPGQTIGLGKINISGEGGFAFFHSQSEGQFSKAQFRLDEARIFVEAPVWKNVYLFSELDIALRESDGLNLRAGQLYLDIEDVSQLWGKDRQLNLRVGRFYIPFGEEYQTRNAIDNPLISHSLSDLWGVDQRIEMYGALGKFHYVLAVQNGGDKSWEISIPTNQWPPVSDTIQPDGCT